MNLDCLNAILDKTANFVVYGAGLRGDVVVKTLVDFGLNCMAVVDADLLKQGKMLYGVEIFSKDYLKTLDKNVKVIISIANCKPIYEELKSICNVMPVEAGDYLIRLSYLNCEGYGFKQIENIGSYMSPYPDVNKYAVSESLLDIDLNMDIQKKWFERFVNIYKDLENKQSVITPRYYEENTKYGVIDALVLHGMIKELRPKKIIEIGSGFSSAIMLDTNEFYFNNQIHLEFVEPYPARLNSLLKETDHISLQDCFLQDANLEIFDKLESGDILFVDSSHMAKMGSDVNKIIFEILPKLKSGVYIHFHDIFNNFEYPEEWLRNGWVWNECYLLRAFLMNNNDYEIVFFCDMWNDDFNKTGLFKRFVGGGNIWLKKK